MEYINLGSTGLKVSRICLGAMTYGSKRWREWVLEEEESRPFIKRALELGINFFDTADMYSVGKSEEILGRALRMLESFPGVLWRAACWREAAGPGLHAPKPTIMRTSCIQPRPTSAWWIACSRWPRRAVCQLRKLRWPGCFTSRELQRP